MKSRYRNLLRNFFVLAVINGVSGLKDVKVEIPEAVAVGSQVTLTCRYDLQTDVLYAVKWYKGKDEFYRFVPKELPPLLVFGSLFAHNIDRTTSDAHHVTITNVTKEMEGKYRCEVTNDIPDFHTLRKVGYMHVVSLPQGSPEVLVEKQRYAIGETVKANCTTPPSNPATNVTWTVNGIPVNASYHRSIPMGNDNRTRAYAELDFEITQDSFTSGKLKIICHANIFKLYKREAIATVEEERPRLASVLGTRDSPHTNVGSKHTAEWALCVVTAANLVLRGLR